MPGKRFGAWGIPDKLTPGLVMIYDNVRSSGGRICLNIQINLISMIKLP